MNEETSSATALPRCRRLVEEREENGGFKTNVVNEGVTGGLVKDLVNEEDSERGGVGGQRWRDGEKAVHVEAFCLYLHATHMVITWRIAQQTLASSVPQVSLTGVSLKKS